MGASIRRPYDQAVPTVTDQAVCIRHWDWSETSQTVSLFSREQGLLRAVAKGARRENAPFSGGLEVLTRGEMVAIVKPSADLANLIAWDLQEVFPALRRSLTAFYSGMYMADVVQSSVTEHDPHPALFDALLDALRTLGDGRDGAAVLRLQWAALSEAGYLPELELDVARGTPLERARAYTFLPRLGGFSASTPDSGPAWRVRAETRDGLRSLAGDDPGVPADVPPETVERASRLLAIYLREVLAREMPSMQALFGTIEG
jgi:DNA repair protein RecO (recombination protein O)